MPPRTLHLDWTLLGATVPLALLGLLTMSSFVGENYFAARQVLWLAVSYGACIACSFIDWRFLKNGILLAMLFLLSLAGLGLLMIGSRAIRGAHSWFSLGGVSFEAADFVKLLVIIILAKYFSRRHIEIARIRHVFISGIYAFVPFLLVFFQPNIGSALVIFFIWLGMVMVSGVSKKHLVLVACAVAASFGVLWFFVFAPYQKARIINFLHPLADVRGAGYNAFQSQIAVGSGQVWGKGVGFGTQSRLNFLPEYQTDFIFSAFAEEWGLVGILFVLALFAALLFRILKDATRGDSNFETLFAVGYAIFLMSHVIINVGMNMGILPVTGIPLPFLSYGGSHLLAEFIGLGMVMSMHRYARAAHRDDMRNEFLGPV